MPISQTDQLFSLIKSLTPSEKRNFRLFVNRMSDSGSLKYIQLFDQIERTSVADDRQLIAALKNTDKSRFSNLKRHLYAQIMSSLEQYHKPRRVDVQVRELLNFAHILYGKGLILQALKILQKAKVKAARHHYDLHYLSILEFEKKIESRHITRSGADHSLQLGEESEQRNRRMYNAIRLSNLRVRMHNTYIKYGHVRNDEDAQRLTDAFYDRLPQIPKEEMGVKERVYLYQAFVWYSFILLDFHQCFEHARWWVDMLRDQKNMAKRDPDLLMRGYHYLLTAAYHVRDRENYARYLDEIERFRKENYKQFNLNSKVVSFLYVHNARLNYYVLTEAYADGIAVVPRTLKRIARYRDKLDAHRIMVLYYKIAWIYLCAGEAAICVEYLQKIITQEVRQLRRDLQIYTRLMFLMAHYDLQNEQLMEYLVQTTATFFKKMESTNRLQSCCLQFFQEIVKTPLTERRAVLRRFLEDLESIRASRYEQRAFLYLDIISWIRDKIGVHKLLVL